MQWLDAVLVEAIDETPTSRTLVFDVPGWRGHLAGQHLDLRVTAPDGYSASREYSIASGASVSHGGSAPDARVELSVEELETGEVSPFLVRDLEVGDTLEVRGPVGGYFVWTPAQTEPVQLIAGGSGVVPLMSMLRTHAAAKHPSPMRLLYSARGPLFGYYAAELASLAQDATIALDHVYTRDAPSEIDRSVGRLTRADLQRLTFPPAPGPDAPLTYVCGPNGFVESVASWLVELGHDPERVRTERFGGT